MTRIPRGRREELLREFRRFSGTQKEFCEQQGLNLSTLQSWLYKRPKGFSEVKLPDRVAVGRVVAAVTVSNVRVELFELPEPGYVAELAEAIR